MGQAVVFFDGVCGLCDRFVTWLVARDRRGRLKFAPLQGSTAASAGLSPGANGPESIVFMEEGIFYRKSAATLRILTRLGGAWKAFAIFYIFPLSLRDASYDFVARRRYGWFGKRENCRLPSPSERERVLP